jgi:hypothetical protein
MPSFGSVVDDDTFVGRKQRRLELLPVDSHSDLRPLCIDAVLFLISES